MSEYPIINQRYEVLEAKVRSYSSECKRQQEELLRLRSRVAELEKETAAAVDAMRERTSNDEVGALADRIAKADTLIFLLWTDVVDIDERQMDEKSRQAIWDMRRKIDEYRSK